MNYWLLKSEPYVWSIDDQIKAGNKGIAWDGVRNYQAANNLKKMKEGDLCFFYHSNLGKEIVGIVKVTKAAFLDKTDKKKRFVAVQVRFVEEFNSPISLEKIKKCKEMIDKSGCNVEIEVDGGIGVKNIKSISDAGANIFVAGSAIFKTESYKEAISKMKQEISAN